MASSPGPIHHVAGRLPPSETSAWTASIRASIAAGSPRSATAKTLLRLASGRPEASHVTSGSTHSRAPRSRPRSETAAANAASDSVTRSERRRRRRCASRRRAGAGMPRRPRRRAPDRRGSSPSRRRSGAASTGGRCDAGCRRRRIRGTAHPRRAIGWGRAGRPGSGRRPRSRSRCSRCAAWPGSSGRRPARRSTASRRCRHR